MNKCDLQFISELFLDSDCVTDTNKIVVAVGDLVKEHTNNLSLYSEVFEREFSNYVESDDHKVSVRTKKESRNFYETVVVHYNDEEYEDAFRMKKSTVQALIAYLKENTSRSTSQLTLEKKIHVYLSLLTSNYSYAEIGSLYGLHKSSVNYILNEISTMLVDLRYNFISWPSIEDQQITRIKINSKFKFPNCLGFIDAMKFKIYDLKDKKRTQLVLLQAVCDESYMFTDVFIGNVGVVRKSKVYKSSPLSKELPNFMDFDYHILGSTDYKLHNNLIIPYTSEEIVTSEEMQFNEALTNAHRYIKDAFRLLTERFKRLGNIDIKAENVKNLIYAACVLHNFVILNEGVFSIKEERVTYDEPVTIDSEIVKNAAEKREFLCNYINAISDIDNM